MEKVLAWGMEIPVHRCGALIIGSGCAGFNAADTLFDLGCRDILLVTEGINMGTSRNTGSDKQTYYKLAWQSGEADSTEKMTQALFEGRSVHGDTALAEAANSIRCFMKLVQLGVPFPTNRFGEFVGYQTDHSTAKRATSAGPLTSRYMTEALEKETLRKQIPILDGMVIVELVRDDAGIIGAVGIQKREVMEPHKGIHFFLTERIVLATGGPAAVYENRVYPPSQTGMTGLAIEAGALCANLQEWQYGIASQGFRWNLSGTYQQVIPRYISVDKDGTTREFLQDYFEDPVEGANLVFQKGYQWPFDSGKLDGSTVIDLLVYHEQVDLGRQVYLDYTTGPAMLKDGLQVLSQEAYSYLKNSDALLDTPIKRLEKMNPQAIELYRSHGIDLYTQLLPITVAAQHCNGGVAVDVNWQSSVPGLYVAGEAAGTFGVTRPGGSALNSTQVGSLRAAEHIAFHLGKRELAPEQLAAHAGICGRFFEVFEGKQGGNQKIHPRIGEILQNLSHQMSAYGAHLRQTPKLRQLRKRLEAALQELDGLIPELKEVDIVSWFKVRDTVISSQGVLESILYGAATIGTRGGSVCCESALDFTSAEALRHTPVNGTELYDNQVLYYHRDRGCSYERVRPIPRTEQWFERVWADYRKRRDM